MSSRKNYECSKESEHENELEQQLRSDIDLFGLSNLLSKLNEIKFNGDYNESIHAEALNTTKIK